MTRAKAILGRFGERLSEVGGKMGSRAFISLTSMKQEVEAMSLERMERLARRLGLARRAEVEELRALVRELRLKQEEILKKLEARGSRAGKNAVPSARPRSAAKSKAAKSKV